MAKDFNVFAILGQVLAMDFVESIPIVDTAGVGLPVAAVKHNCAIALIVLAIEALIGIEQDGAVEVVVILIVVIVVIVVIEVVVVVVVVAEKAVKVELRGEIA